jgi:serine/threonine-protein phosphatase 4 regulatory subunit 1
LADTARQIGIEKSVDHIVPVLHELKDDGEPVIRQALVEQVAELAPIFKEGGESGYVKILHDMLPTVAALTTDSNPQVRQSAMEALVEVGKVLEHDHIQPHLLPIVKSLAKDNTEEEHRVEGAQLLNDLAPIMQQQLCTQFAVPHIKTLAADAMFRVRKAVASHMGNICEIVGAEETTSQLVRFGGFAVEKETYFGIRDLFSFSQMK